MSNSPKPQEEPPASPPKRAASPASPTLSPAHKRSRPSRGEHASTAPEENTLCLSGQARWQQERAQWLQSAANGSANGGADEPPIRRQPIGPHTTYEELLATNRVFDEPIPLKDMIDFLMEAWIDEGLCE